MKKLSFLFFITILSLGLNSCGKDNVLGGGDDSDNGSSSSSFSYSGSSKYGIDVRIENGFYGQEVIIECMNKRVDVNRRINYLEDLEKRSRNRYNDGKTISVDGKKNINPGAVEYAARQAIQTLEMGRMYTYDDKDCVFQDLSAVSIDQFNGGTNQFIFF